MLIWAGGRANMKTVDLVLTAEVTRMKGRKVGTVIRKDGGRQEVNKRSRKPLTHSAHVHTPMAHLHNAHTHPRPPYLRAARPS